MAMGGLSTPPCLFQKSVVLSCRDLIETRLMPAGMWPMCLRNGQIRATNHLKRKTSKWLMPLKMTEIRLSKT